MLRARVAAIRAARHLHLRAMTTATPLTAPRGAIALSETEEKFVTLLDEFARGFEPAVECRIAGGWVRDKLLDLPSHDLDVALSTTSGYQFAEQFAQFLHTKDVVTGSVGRVAANPEQSKHLETGTTTIMGLECDFVGLRSETYTDSRIPDAVKLGTPLEDAQRRDLTINSLFFNVHSREIEDWTRHGLADLDARIARTPLPPRQTFLDDPLRVLRAVRFASRFGLAIQPDVAWSIRQDDIQAALRTKVSKERVGIEIGKMVQKTPVAAMRMIMDLGLHASIFTCAAEPPHPREEAMKATLVLEQVLQKTGWEGDEPLWLAAAVCPFRGASVVQKKRDVPAVSVLISEALKLSAAMTEAVTNLFEAANALQPGLDGRARIGMILRTPACRPYTRSITWAAVDRILPTWTGEWTSEHDAILSSWVSFRRKVEDYGLPAAIDQPPLIDGSTLQPLLGLKPGPLLRVLLLAITEWQLDHPEATPAECQEWLMSEWNGDGRRTWEKSVPAPVQKTKAKKRKET